MLASRASAFAPKVDSQFRSAFSNGKTGVAEQFPCKSESSPRNGHCLSSLGYFGSNHENLKLLATCNPRSPAVACVSYSRSALEAPQTSEQQNPSETKIGSGAHTAKRLSLTTLTAPVSQDLVDLNENLKTVVGERHPMLMSAAEQIFGAGGKRMRPALIFLVSRATAQLGGLPSILPQHRRLAEITEMIHTASLMHDDVLDDSNFRRGKQTVHQKYGTRVAVLAGDFMFAQSSWMLANLDNLPVIKLISQVIADFANGEIQQAASLFDCDLTLEDYLEKSYFKTASLIAASTKSAAIFSDVGDEVSELMFGYGKHLGLAFQVVDDILDFTQTSEQLGKPAGSDLASGNLTAPVLFALRGDQGPELRELIDSEFVEKDSLSRAISIVVHGGGIDAARRLAREEGLKARNCLQCLHRGELYEALDGMVDYVLERLY